MDQVMAHIFSYFILWCCNWRPGNILATRGPHCFFVFVFSPFERHSNSRNLDFHWVLTAVTCDLYEHFKYFSGNTLLLLDSFTFKSINNKK